MQFSEKVHLTTCGGGFLRVPFLNSTQDPSADLRPGECPVLNPQIIHLPAAGRLSGLSLAAPNFRRVVLSSTLCNQLTTDAAAQLNQEGAGITFAFHDQPDRNMALARCGPDLLMMNERILLLDAPGVNEGRPVDITTVPPLSMATGFLAFITRAWRDLRHVDPKLLLSHQVPLQIDSDFDIIPLSSTPFRVFMPILGNKGSCIVYDPALGPTSADPNGSTIGDFGSATVQPDGQGGFYIDLTLTPDNQAVVGIAIADQTGQIFARNLVIQDAFPAGATIRLPHGMIGVPYRATLPCGEVLCRLYGQDCSSGNTITSILSMILPPGLSYNATDNSIEGTPTGYGTNYGILPEVIPQEGLQGLGLSLTINRPPRLLMSLSDLPLNHDRSTGEYYAIQFMPYGSVLVYGGDSYEFRRFLSNDQPWPGMIKKPYLYGLTSRQSASAQEGFWREMP